MLKQGLRILFVTPYIPASTRPRPWGFIQELSKRHKVTVVCLVQPAWEAYTLDELKEVCEAVYPIYPNRFQALANAFLSLPTPIPFSVAYSASRPMKETIQRLIREKKFDLIHTEFIRAAQYTVSIKGIPKILDLVDSLTLNYGRALRDPHTHFSSRMLALEEWTKLRSYESKMAKQFDRAVICSPADAEQVRQEGGLSPEVIPHGVELEFKRDPALKRAENSLVFLGKMNYYVNVDSILYFYKFIFPLIRAKRADVDLTIVGWNPTKSVRALADDPAVQVTGSVPDFRPYLLQSTVFIAPLISGAGLQTKILQAMAVGIPIVTTSLAAKALGHIQEGVHLLVADQPSSFAESVLCLLESPSLQDSLIANSRRYVEQYHDWGVLGQQLENLYEEVLQQTSG